MTSVYFNFLGVKQGWEFDLSIFDLSIFSIPKKYKPWSNRSRQSLKKINRDRISLSITKTSDLIKKKNFLCMFLTVFPLFRPNDWIVPIDLQTLIFLKDHWNRLALVILWKRSTVIESISSIIEKDRRDWMDPVDL